MELGPSWLREWCYLTGVVCELGRRGPWSEGEGEGISEEESAARGASASLWI